MLFNCKSQSIIIPMGSGQNIEHSQNYYLKDSSNEFDKFIGEWKYQNGNSVFVLRLKKEVQYQTPFNYFRDLLVGEYQFIENGVEIINTLSNLDNTSINGRYHKINGGAYLRRLPSYCNDNSTSQEIKIEVQIEDPNDSFTEGRLILRHIIENGIEKLEVCLLDESSMAASETSRLAIPDGFYVFVKQD